jgi:acid phosphatase
VQPPAAPVPSGAAIGAEVAASQDLLAATLWVQTAEEYRGLARQSYRLAAQRLEAALADPRISALIGDQTGAGSNLPPAVILDIDDTVLDNSPFEARLILDRQPYTTEAWYQWCREEKAEAIPGALAFVRTVEARGVAVFYVTNRDAELEAATRRNLQKLGFPEEPAAEDRILSRGELPDWGSEKESRRRLIAERYRILLLVGDDLGDFVAGARATVEERHRLAAAHEERWGREWILLPNPMYGSWERALLRAEDPSSNKTPRELKRDALKPHRPVP